MFKHYFEFTLLYWNSFNLTVYALYKIFVPLFRDDIFESSLRVVHYLEEM